MRHMPPTNGTSGSYLPYLMHGVMSLIMFAAFVALAIIVIRKYRKGQLHAPAFMSTHRAMSVENDPYLSALKILNERFAKGELDVDEYYSRRTALKGPDPTPEA